MAQSSTETPRGVAAVLVVRDVLQSMEHYRDVLGSRVEFTYGEPTFYAGVRGRHWGLACGSI